MLWGLGVTTAGGAGRVATLSAAAYGRRLPVTLPDGHRRVLHPLAHPNLLLNPQPDTSPGLAAVIAAFRAGHARWAEQAALDLRP